MSARACPADSCFRMLLRWREAGLRLCWAALRRALPAGETASNRTLLGAGGFGSTGTGASSSLDNMEGGPDAGTKLIRRMRDQAHPAACLRLYL